MTVTLQEIETALATGLSYVQALAPLAGSLAGPAGAAIGETVAKVAGTAETILTQVESDAAILATGDITKIRALEQSIQAENTQLLAQAAAT